MFLFILDSIGTSELILIGIIALMFLGPRKLPQIAKTIGKTLADFRNTTNEFKATWQREVDFEEDIRAMQTGELPDETPTTVARTDKTTDEGNSIAAPTIKPVQTDLFADVLPENENESQSAVDTTETAPTDDASDKRNWL